MYISITIPNVEIKIFKAIQQWVSQYAFILFTSKTIFSDVKRGPHPDPTRRSADQCDV